MQVSNSRPPFDGDQTVPEALAAAMTTHADRIAFFDDVDRFSYARLGECTTAMAAALPAGTAVAIFGMPSARFGVAVTACVTLGRPIVHLDPAMPKPVLDNILSELKIDTVVWCQDPKPGQLDSVTTLIEAEPLFRDAPTISDPVEPGPVANDDPIYIVATSGTTGKPKCIPVTHRSAQLSYAWRDAHTPYGPGYVMGAYIFAIWEFMRPIRVGGTVCFPTFTELMTPRALVDFLHRNAVDEMLFTPSALEKTLQSLSSQDTRDLPLSRIVLNGEVVSNALIAAVKDKLPKVDLWNLYSICETHDVSMTLIDGPQDGSGSVGKPMPHITPVVLDDYDRPCPQGVPGYLYFEGDQMLGPGYVGRPNETALRFRTLDIGGRTVRLYDTGDQGYLAEDGTIHVVGRVAHMLKLRGHSIQTKELTETLQSHMQFYQAIPWVVDVDGRRQALVLYYTATQAQADANRARWDLPPGEARVPAELATALSAVLPGYCVPSYFVQLPELPLDPVSGKCDFRKLPPITDPAPEPQVATDMLPTVAECANITGQAANDMDPDRSFQDHGGDSLMAVNFLLALEEVYQTRVDFDLALQVPLGRLHDLLSAQTSTVAAHGGFDRPGILLTGATGFLGSRTLAAAASVLPPDHVIYCVVRPKQQDPVERLLAVARAEGVDADRVVVISSPIETPQFGLDAADYAALTAQVKSVVHCAAMVNLAVARDKMEDWVEAGITNVLKVCKDADADLRFSSSTSVFPDRGGPHAEAPTAPFDGCSGYGAAKIAAERLIATSGVPAAIVRLPSLCDIDRPNPQDIYETILTACAGAGAAPKGMTFRMLDVHVAARFLMGAAPRSGGAYYNLIPPFAFTADQTGLPRIPVQDWLARAPLRPAQRSLILSDLSVLQADASYDTQSAADEWTRMSGQDLKSVSNPAAVLDQRLSGVAALVG